MKKRILSTFLAIVTAISVISGINFNVFAEGAQTEVNRKVEQTGNADYWLPNTVQRVGKLQKCKNRNGCKQQNHFQNYKKSYRR